MVMSSRDLLADEKAAAASVRRGITAPGESHAESVAASVGLQIRRTSASSCSCRAFTHGASAVR
jgi:hypothetical protein